MNKQDKEELKHMLLILLCLWAFFGLSIWGTYWANTSASKEFRIIECYDNQGNEILGLSCEKVVYDSMTAKILDDGIVAIMMGFITILFTILFFIGLMPR